MTEWVADVEKYWLERGESHYTEESRWGFCARAFKGETRGGSKHRPRGTTKNLVARMLDKGSGLKCGEDFWLANYPERIGKWV